MDERVGQHLADRELSIGDYVLSGGELGAAVIVDCVTRLIPGAVGNQASTQQESFTSVLARRQAGERPETRRAPRADCWITRTTRVPRTFAAWQFRKCWHRAIMKKYGAGAVVQRLRKRCATGPIFWTRPRSATKTRELLAEH